MEPESPGPITELEAKFIIPDKATFKKLNRLTKVADATLHSKRTHRVRDAYYDTTDRRLFAAGQTLRYRKTGPHAEVCLKGLGGVQGGIHQRQELSAPMPGRFRWKAWQETPVYAQTQRILGTGTLNKLFVLRQTRTVFGIRRGGVDVALLSLDRVRLTIDGRKHTWFELEIEQTADGSPDDVADLARYFRAEWGLSPQPVSKFGRGLGFLDAVPAQPAAPPPKASPAPSADSPPEPEPPDLQADDSMAEAARKILRHQLDRMQAFEPVVFQDDDIEGVHQMRVATRKMRVALRLFKPYLPAESRTGVVNKGLQRTARALGAVRDLDVFWENVQRSLATGGRSKLRPDDLLPLEDIWRAERNRQVRALHNYLRSKAHRRFKTDFAAMLDSLVESPPAPAQPPSPNRLRHIVPTLLYGQLARIRAYDDLVSGGTISTPQLHALRIEFKRLRYTLDFFGPILSERNTALINVCKQIQTHLGDLNDAEMAIRHLRTVLRRGAWQKPDKRSVFPARILVAPGVQMYLNRQAALKARLKAGFPRMWQRTQSKKFKQLFANNLKTL